MIPANFFTSPFDKANLNELLNEAVMINSDLLADQNTIQLRKGIDTEGNDLGEYANFGYKGRWKPVDLRLTGDFHNSIHPVVYSDWIEMNASDWKAEYLVLRYGESIIGFPSEEAVGEIIKEDFQNGFAIKILE